MKIKIELEREEWQTLMELVFLGEYAVNACRSPQEISRKHADLADAMYRRQYEAENDVSDPDAIEENEIADVRDQIYDRVQEALERFVTDVCMEKVAELTAQREFPVTRYDEAQMIRREIAEGLLKQKLHAEGIGAVGIDYPALRETVERMTMSVMNAKK